jgi:hypothetical protein
MWWAGSQFIPYLSWIPFVQQVPTWHEEGLPYLTDWGIVVARYELAIIATLRQYNKSPSGIFTAWLPSTNQHQGQLKLSLYNYYGTLNASYPANTRWICILIAKHVSHQHHTLLGEATQSIEYSIYNNNLYIYIFKCNQPIFSGTRHSRTHTHPYSIILENQQW